MEPLIVKAFKDFVETSKFFNAPFDVSPPQHSDWRIIQLVTAFGYANDKAQPNYELMFDLLEVLEIPADSQIAWECCEGNVY